MKSTKKEAQFLPVRPKENDLWVDVEEYLLYLRHLAAYHFALSYAKEKLVLDVGCGAGYGTNLLSKSASLVVGVDLSKDEIKNCKEKYRNQRLSWIRASGNNLPFKEGIFNLCVSFQVIEHINPKQVNDFLSEIDRILAHRDILIVTTPNKKLRLLPFQKPWNPEHLKEYSSEEFRETLENTFTNVKIYGLYGKREVQAIEENRVRPDPMDAYVLKPFYTLIHVLFPVFATKLKNSLLSSRYSRKTVKELSSKEKYSIHDFQIRKEIERCIDFVGVCFTK